MIWALLAWYLLGGAGVGSGAILTSSGVEAIEEKLVEVVFDDVRLGRATDTLQTLRKDLKSFEKRFVRSGRQLNKLYEEHEVNRDATYAILDELNADWAAGQQQALDARFALRDALTEAEWNEMFGADSASGNSP